MVLHHYIGTPAICQSGAVIESFLSNRKVRLMIKQVLDVILPTCYNKSSVVTRNENDAES
jgi:hypothetical protein